MRQEVYEEKERQRREAGLRHQGGPHARPHRYGKDNHFRFTKTEDSAQQDADAGEDGEPPKKKMSLNWLCKFFMEGGASACRNGVNVRPRAATALRAAGAAMPARVSVVRCACELLHATTGAPPFGGRHTATAMPR